MYSLTDLLSVQGASWRSAECWGAAAAGQHVLHLQDQLLHGIDKNFFLILTALNQNMSHCMGENNTVAGTILYMTPGREDRTFKGIEKDDTIGVFRRIGILEMNILTIYLEGKTFLNIRTRN